MYLFLYRLKNNTEHLDKKKNQKDEKENGKTS